MFDRYEAGEQAVLVHIDFSDHNKEDVDEFQELVNSANIEICTLITGKRDTPHSKYFCGSGKVQEIADAVQLHQANVVIFNHALSPAQERNIESLVKCRVVNRISLILDIFAQRASSFEGKLQVELAQLRHLSTRLVRGWTHLERQKGGIGLRGPGETQLETDRRLLRGRIKTIESRLQKVSKQRQQGRRARRRAEVTTVSIVGYTNAGKSTLFNALTDSSVYEADQLFATLDPTFRKMQLPSQQDVIIADTVGFIRHLPHELVAAFSATLEESREADLLLHVVDASSDERHHNIEQVNVVLAEIGADEVPVLMVMNKIDHLEGMVARIEYGDEEQPQKVWLSAKTGEGLDGLREAVQAKLNHEVTEGQLSLSPDLSVVRSLLYELKAVQKESYDESGNICLQIDLPKIEWNRLVKQYPDLTLQSDIPK